MRKDILERMKIMKQDDIASSYQHRMIGPSNDL